MSNEYQVGDRFGPLEVDLRGAGFLGGRPIRLADHAEWLFPDPEDVESVGEPLLSEVMGLLDAIAWAEDAAERRRGELALAIRLLAANYDLGPNEYSRLLTFAPGDPDLAVLQDDLRSLACRHAEGLRSARESSAHSPGHRARRASTPVGPGGRPPLV